MYIYPFRVGVNHKFWRVKSFKYLRAVVTEFSEVGSGIKASIAAGNKCYFAFQKSVRPPDALLALWCPRERRMRKKGKISIFSFSQKQYLSFATESSRL